MTLSAIRADITALDTSALIDAKITTRCHAYGPTDIDLAGSWFNPANSDGTITEPTRTRADFTMLNAPPGIIDSGRDHRAFTAKVNAQDQINYKGDSGGPCLATSGPEEIYGIIVAGTLPPCTNDSPSMWWVAWQKRTALAEKSTPVNCRGRR